MLVFAASNSKIKAETCFEKSAHYAQAQAQGQVEEIKRAMQEQLMYPSVALATIMSERDIRSFRDIESFTDAFVFQQLHKHDRTFLIPELVLQ